MGMFDTIVHNRTDICCPNGHVLKDPLQTKDFDCNLDVYRLDGKGFLHAPTYLQGPHPFHHKAFPKSDVLVGNHEVEGCDFCKECFPPYGSNGPLYTFSLVFIDGKLFSVERSEF